MTANNMLELFRRNKSIIVALGIFLSFFFFGILQEEITKSLYITESGEAEKFTYATSLVGCLCFISLCVSKIAQLIFAGKTDDDLPPQKYFAANALTYTLAMICTNMSLEFVNYPTQVIAKSCKPIPVMILGVLLVKKSYSWRKYVSVFMVVVGVALFIYKEQKGSSKQTEGYVFGQLLLFFSLTMDGITSSIQEYLVRDYKTKPMDFMYYVNVWSSLYIIMLTLGTGEFLRFLPFVQRHPEVMWRMLTLGLANSCGQIFIFIGVASFGPLHVSIITTVRKLFTVLTSVILFGNSLELRQWLATVIVFTGLTMDIFYGKTPPKTKVSVQH